MKTQSAKAKGRNLQKYVAERILLNFAELQPDDVKSTSMGNSGEDVQLSPTARKILPISIECKSHARYAIYKDYEQAQHNAKHYQPVVIIKQNKSQPLAVIDFNFLLKLLRG